MRKLLLIPASLALTAAVGAALCAAAGWRVAPANLLAALAAALLACAAGLLPVVLARHASQPAVAQAALLGSMMHLLVSVIAAAAVILAKLPLGQGFLYWLMAFYWTTLAAMVAVYIGAIKAAPAGPATPPSSVRPDAVPSGSKA